MAGNISISTDNSANHIFDNSDNTILLNSLYGDYQNIVIKQNSEWFEQIEYIIFRNEMKSIKKNYLVVLKECKENKRLLDLKYDDLNTIVNNIQTSVIFFSTFSGILVQRHAPARPGTHFL